jgi:hypothetical protein
MSDRASGLRERIRLAVEGPVSESQKLLIELKDASAETKLSILISGWGRGLADGLEELAIAIDELFEREPHASREPMAATAPREQRREPRPAEEQSGESELASAADKSEEQLLEEARESREQTAELKKETEQFRDEPAP